jgi:hypothetical protein
MASTASRRPRRIRARPETDRACPFLCVLLAIWLPAGCRSDPEPKAPPVARASENIASAEIGRIRWYLDYDKALAIARETDKPLWVHFGEHPG